MKCSFVAYLGGGEYPCPWEAVENGLCETHLGRKVEMVFEEPAKPLGWCHFVSKGGKRCSNFATIKTERGNFCSFHGGK